MRPPFFAEISETLCESIRYTIRYHSKNSDGETRAERNARFDMAHHTPEEPEIPEYLGYLIGWFWELSSRRKSGMGSYEPIGYADIGYWRDLTGSDPTPQEVGVLVAMDVAFLAAFADEARDESDKKAKQK